MPAIRRDTFGGFSLGQRFPEDFMFQLTKGELEILRSHLVTIDSLISHNVTSNSSDNQEVKNWKSQNATSKSAKMGWYLPSCLFRPNF